MSVQPGPRPGPEKACGGGSGQVPCTVRHPDARPGVQVKCPTAQRGDSLEGVRTPGNLFNPLKDACRKRVAGGLAPSIWLTNGQRCINPLPTPVTKASTSLWPGEGKAFYPVNCNSSLWQCESSHHLTRYTLQG